VGKVSKGVNRRGFDVASVYIKNNDPAVAEAAKRAVGERRAAEDQAFADKLAKRPPPDPVERAEIEKGQKANQSPRAPHCHARRRSWDSRKRLEGVPRGGERGPRGYCGARGRERDLRLNQSCRSWSGSESRTLRPAVI
jgi:hypothetical protein